MADGDNNIMRFSELKYYDEKLKEYIDNEIDSNKGTSIEANPSSAGTTDLTKLEIGGTIYNIPDKVTYSTTDITAGTTPLQDGYMYLVYE